MDVGDPYSFGAADDADMDLDLPPLGGPAKLAAPAARFRPKIKGKAKAEPADGPRRPPPPAPVPVKKQEDAEVKAEVDPPSLVPKSSSIPSASDTEAEDMEAEPMDVAGEDKDEASDGMEDAEEDAVVREIDVFCSPNPIDEDTNLYVMQYVLRPSWRPYELNERCQEVRLKPNESKLEIDLRMDVDSENYNQEADPITRLEKQTLCSSTTPLSTSYAVGILKGNQLHLNPVHAVVQFRPSVNHLNARLQKKMLNAPSVESGRTPNDSAKASAEKPATAGSNEKEVDEPWVTLEYHPVDSELTERYYNKMLAGNNYEIPFVMNRFDYVDALCPISSTENKRTKVLPRRFLPKLPTEERLKKWLSEISQVNHFKALTHLAHDMSEEELLKILPLYADLVQGLWVCKSSLLYEADSAAIRDFILYEFSLKPTSRLEKLKNIHFDVKSMLIPLALKRPILGDWKFKEPTDLAFIKEHPDIVKQQEHSWSNRAKNFQTLRSVNPRSASALGAKDRPGTKVVFSISNETREHLPKALVKIFQEKRTRSMNSIINGLRTLAISNSSRPRDDPKTKALINAATNGASAPVAELEAIVNLIAINIHGVYVLKSCGNMALDPLRRVVIDLFRGKEVNAKINKRDICIAIQSSLKRDISDAEYKQITQELCVSSRGSWMLKSGD